MDKEQNKIDLKRRLLEIGFWLLFVGFFWTLGAFTMINNYESSKIQVWMTRLVTNEITSALSALVMIFFVRYWLTRFPVSPETWRRDLVAHLAGSVLFTLGHVGLFMLMRSLAFAAVGWRYVHSMPGDSGIPGMLVYEYNKDIIIYIGFTVIIWNYRKWMTPVSDSGIDYPVKILASKGTSEKAVPTSEIEWIQSAANYVSLFSRGEEYLIRNTMSNMEKQMDPDLFVRVHRSYMVSLDAVDELFNAASGRQMIRLKNGTEIPLGRKFRDNLLARLKLGYPGNGERG